MDHLSLLLNRFSLSAGVFYTGTICGVHDFPDDALQGHLHLVRQGPVEVLGLGGEPVQIAAPTLLFLPRPRAHRLVADEGQGAQVVCGTVRFGGGSRNPIADSLPDTVLVPLAALPGADALLDLMLDEAFSGRYGGQAALDRLCEVLMIRLLRYCVDHGLTRDGVLAGLADGRLAKALVAIHEDPARDWQLADMAALAGMSRARFAPHFRKTVGDTPAGYLAAWRIMAAQRLLRQGLRTKQVAFDVGYGSASALSRAFVRHLGCTPSAWLDGLPGAAGAGQDETSGAGNETPGSPAGAAPGQDGEQRNIAVTGEARMSKQIIHQLAPVEHAGAQGRQKEVLDAAHAATGFIPNMYANMANAPAVLDTYLHGYAAFRAESGFTPAEQEVVFLSISQYNGCTYCTAAHSMIADKMSQVPAAVLQALRARQPIPDARLAALAAMAVEMVSTHGQPSAEVVRRFLDAGYREQDLLYIVLAAAVKTLSNYSNQAFGTELDAAFADYRVS